MLVEEPNRAYERNDMEDPKCVNSKTEARHTEPTCIQPAMETLDPMRVKLRIDKELPKLAKFRTEAALPRRTMARIDKELPKEAKLKKLTADPHLMLLRRDIELPKETKLRIEVAEPSLE